MQVKAMTAQAPAALSRRKLAIRELADRLAPKRDAYIRRNRGFHEEDVPVPGMYGPSADER